jgi:hypothetical protein
VAAPGTSGSDLGSVESDKQAILDNVVKLIQTAPLKPGGDNFAIATQNLNKYFSTVGPEQFAIASPTRALLLQQMPEGVVQDLEDRTFRMPDARHIEDCMLYHSVATRVGGVGDDEARVRRVFRWIITQIQLVPPGALAAPRLGQAEARPYDVLMRGMATEDGGSWAERGWLFLVLCRQLGVDACLLTYTPQGAKDPVVWTCAALIEGKLCLFDTRLGLEIPSTDGVAVATLDDALADPGVLAQLDLPGQASYPARREILLASPSKIGVLIDSSPHYRSPRMKLLQDDLAGRNRTVLYSDLSDERDRLLRALGKHAGSVDFWELPARVEHFLFTNPKFVEATIFSLVLFDPNRFPLVYARMKQLHGDLPDAIQDYVTFRFAENPIEVNKRAAIPPETQHALDIYATYFLGLCRLEQGDVEHAEFFFKETLRLLPEPGRGQPYVNMFRWGAQANLGRLYEARGDDARAIAYYTQHDPTLQQHGNLIRARELVWRAPTADLPPQLPAAPLPVTPPPLLAAPPGK